MSKKEQVKLLKREASEYKSGLIRLLNKIEAAGATKRDIARLARSIALLEAWQNS